jgi:hypothetical protein
MAVVLLSACSNFRSSPLLIMTDFSMLGRLRYFGATLGDVAT